MLAPVPVFLAFLQFLTSLSVPLEIVSTVQGFDASRSAPSLVNMLTSGQLSVLEKRALVPGCGYVIVSPADDHARIIFHLINR